jgi:dimethylargininase
MEAPIMNKTNTTYAITRTPPVSMAKGITTQKLEVDPYLARKQHQHYLNALQNLGVTVIVLEPEEDFPDSHFVEDAAVIHKQVAILTRPGAEARRGEVACLRPQLERYLTVCELGGDHDATVDGGDVLFMGAHVFIGLSHRTNEAGAKRLKALLTEIDPTLSIYFIPFTGVLHLKSGLTAIGPDLLLANPAMKMLDPLPAGRLCWLPQEEGHAANVLVVNGTAFVFEDTPSAQREINHAGLKPLILDMSEFRKMDGSFTCLSLLW